MVGGGKCKVMPRNPREDSSTTEGGSANTWPFGWVGRGSAWVWGMYGGKRNGGWFLIMKEGGGGACVPGGVGCLRRKEGAEGFGRLGSVKNRGWEGWRWSVVG